MTAEEIEQWRAAIRNGAWFHPDVLKALQHMIHLHDSIRRLQNLKAGDVTSAEMEAVTWQMPEAFIWTALVAAICRGMTQGVKSE